MIDAMAAFEAEGEDRKNDLCDEPDEDLELDEAYNEPAGTSAKLHLADQFEHLH